MTDGRRQQAQPIVGAMRGLTIFIGDLRNGARRATRARRRRRRPREMTSVRSCSSLATVVCGACLCSRACLLARVRSVCADFALFLAAEWHVRRVAGGARRRRALQRKPKNKRTSASPRSWRTFATRSRPRKSSTVTIAKSTSPSCSTFTCSATRSTLATWRRCICSRRPTIKRSKSCERASESARRAALVVIARPTAQGYMTLGILLHENHELIPLIVNSCKVDLDSRNSMFQALALSAIANIGGKEMADSLAPVACRAAAAAAAIACGDARALAHAHALRVAFPLQAVLKLLALNTTKHFVQKRAALCLLRLYRKHPGCQRVARRPRKTRALHTALTRVVVGLFFAPDCVVADNIFPILKNVCRAARARARAFSTHRCCWRAARRRSRSCWRARISACRRRPPRCCWAWPPVRCARASAVDFLPAHRRALDAADPETYSSLRLPTATVIVGGAVVGGA